MGQEESRHFRMSRAFSDLTALRCQLKDWAFLYFDLLLVGGSGSSQLGPIWGGLLGGSNLPKLRSGLWLTSVTVRTNGACHRCLLKTQTAFDCS